MVQPHQCPPQVLWGLTDKSYHDCLGSYPIATYHSHTNSNMPVVQSVSDIESSTPDGPVMSATRDPVPPRGHVGLTRPVTDRNTGDYGHPRTNLSVFQVEAGSKSHKGGRNWGCTQWKCLWGPGIRPIPPKSCLPPVEVTLTLRNINA